MQLQDFQIFRLRIPLKNRFPDALDARDTSESVLLGVAGVDGRLGYGEGAPRQHATGETMDGTVFSLQNAIEFLRDAEIETVQDVARLLEACPGLEYAPSARCAAELALLDLLGKNDRTPVLNLLGEAQTEQIFYSAVISGETPEAIQRQAQQAAVLRIRQVKLNVGNDAAVNTRNIRLLREILGENVDIRADATAAWTEAEAAAQIGRLLDAGVFSVEQPLPDAGPRERWLALQTQLSREALVYVEESVCSYDDARWFAERRAAAGFVLKISKHGGILPSLDVHALAKEHGLFCQLGCHAGETSLLSAAGRIVAALTGDLRACEGSYGLQVLEKDLTARPWQAGFQGIGPVAELLQPGLGVSVDLGLVGDRLSF